LFLPAADSLGASATARRPGSGPRRIPLIDRGRQDVDRRDQRSAHAFRAYALARLVDELTHDVAQAGGDAAVGRDLNVGPVGLRPELTLQACVGPVPEVLVGTRRIGVVEEDAVSRDERNAARTKDAVDLPDAIRLEHVLEDLRTEHHVEAGIGVRQRLGGADVVHPLAGDGVQAAIAPRSGCEERQVRLASAAHIEDVEVPPARQEPIDARDDRRGERLEDEAMRSPRGGLPPWGPRYGGTAMTSLGEPGRYLATYVPCIGS